MRILFYTGKGGVGKTSVASATALQCARLGYKTIVLSTDAAHSLGDSLGVELLAEPIQVLPNLWAQEINALHELEANWGDVQRYVSDLLAWQGVESIAQGELSIVPGTEELFSLLQIKRHHDEGFFDIIVVDAAPTGETLRLLSLPEVTRWWIGRIMPFARGALKVLRPVAKRFTDMPIAADEVLNSAEQAVDALTEVRGLLTNQEICSARIVINLERMVIREAQRSLTYLSLFGYAVDAVIVNRILPADVDGHFAQWRTMQQEYGQQIHQTFAPLPILRVPHFPREVVGTSLLERMGQLLFESRDPSEFFYRGPMQRVERTEEGFDLIVPLPFASEDDIHLAQKADELMVSVGWHRHRIVLPQSLARLRADDAYFDSDELHIVFTQPADTKGTNKR
ncbi:MAG: ArsA family ATPase [Chloroflexaceae bacterium]|nr:ArsA family ATPase [Chloroflexaceae bacterium]